MTEADLRHVLNLWSRAGFFRPGRLGDRMVIRSLTSAGCQTVRLNSQYERRTVARVHVPDDGAPLDDVGRPPSPWEVPVRAPADFQDHTCRLPLPHTEHVGICPECRGSGDVTCSRCHGRGEVDCSSCNGRGYTESSHFVSGHGPNDAGHWETRRDNCPWCRWGRVRCNSCNGSGSVECDDCKGRGRVKFFDQLTVKFHVARAAEAVGGAGLPAKLTLRSRGRVVHDEQAPRIEDMPPLEAAPQARELLAESHAADEGDTRLLFQRLHIEEVPVHAVVYSCGGSRERRLWIYGDDRKVHAPGAPRPWLKLAVLGLGIAALVAGVVWAASLL
jgi:hypothetical protein